MRGHGHFTLTGFTYSETKLHDCIRFAKIHNDSGDPSDSRSVSTMKKTPRVRPI